MPENKPLYTPALVIGSGIAGCAAALTLADRGVEVTLIAAGFDRKEANSWLAQGGIIYKAEQGDPALLEKDLLVAGHRHNNPRAVRWLAGKGPDIAQAVLFDRLNIPFEHAAGPRPEWEWELTREAGHSAPRILYSADHTGSTIMDHLMAAVEGSPNIRILRGMTAVDLLTSHHHTTGMHYRYQLGNMCCGAYVFNEASREVDTILADHTVLATGGVGQLYLHTTNYQGAVGSALSMASRAMVRLENLEYIQFHPTAFFHQNAQRFLITEAIRGEGAILLNAGGERFMRKYDKRLELAPRDIVSQSIVNELLKTGDDCVYLDARGVKHDLVTRFPTIFERCLEYGIDIRNDLIPVVPAAHYFCGGVLTDLSGRTTLERLYAVGECGCTGLHGANRLASSSLLEGLVWGHGAGLDIFRRLNAGHKLAGRLRDRIAPWETPACGDKNDDPALIAQDWASIRNTMWNYVGIMRTQARLYRAFEEMRDLSRHVHDFYHNTPLSKRLVELFHGCQAAYGIIQACLRNNRSLGCHQIKG
ncbi:MAG: FAD-dependent oxidoreductase [Deltaproteobacteria bacterium]|jgi:L-aspartate oxidase|nr:FAD-dependent oxidoreductase [Deltaproteobacteria bacterium]